MKGKVNGGQLCAERGDHFRWDFPTTSLALYIKGATSSTETKAIVSNGDLEVPATGAAADYEGAYSLVHIGSTEVITVTSSENILNPTANGGTVNF